MKIPLFDVDSTLIEGGNKAHSDSFDYALKTVYHRPDISTRQTKMHGMIDTQILIEILKLRGVSEEETKVKMKDAVNAMEDYYFSHQNESNPVVLKGVKKLLDKLKKRQIICGLLTGNIENICWHKLEKAGLKNYFSFGAFGNLAYKRVDLIPIAKKRAEKILNRNISLSDFLIVGDSPLDIACAKAGGIQVIAVAQGAFSIKELTAAKADLVLDSMEEVDRFIEFIHQE